MLGTLRKKAACLKEGTYRTVAAKGRLLAFERTDTTGRLLCICNAGMDEITCDLPHEWHPAEVLLGNTPQGNKLTLDAISCTVLYLQ
jgi:hypothetical protein